MEDLPNIALDDELLSTMFFGPPADNSGLEMTDVDLGSLFNQDEGLGIFDDILPKDNELDLMAQNGRQDQNAEVQRGEASDSDPLLSSPSADEGIELSPQTKMSPEGSEEVANDNDIIESLLSGFPTSGNRLNSVQPLAIKNDNDSLCYVCREKAGKHSYYGGRVCPSCRAFFRRAVQSKYYEIFFCSKGEACDINLKTRRSCQYCRFKKCLESGMRIAWVLPDGERTRKFNKLVKSSPAVTIKRKEPKLTIATEEWAVIEQAQSFICSNAVKALREYILSNPSFFRELVAVCYFGGKMNFDFYKAFNRMGDKFTFDFLMAMEEFRSLPTKDRKTLVDVNGALVNSFKSAVVMQEGLNSCLENGIDSMTKSGQYPFLQDIADKVENLKPQLTYSQFYSSPWAATYDDERTHLELTRKMSEWPRDSPKGPIDDVLATLMKLIMAFSTDFVQLERPDIVSKTQLRYAYLLQRYLKFKYGSDASGKFAAALMNISYARQADEIQARRPPF